MTTKKTDKKEKNVTKKTIKSKVDNTPANDTHKIESIAEEKYFACDIAKNLGIPGFAFLVMKQEAKIDDNSFLTISEFQKIYNQVVGR